MENPKLDLFNEGALQSDWSGQIGRKCDPNRSLPIREEC